LTAPELVKAHVWPPPAVTAITPPDRPETPTGPARLVRVPSPSWPKRLSPQQSTPPALVRAQAWAAPAATAATPLATACGAWPSPQQSSSPTLVRAQVNEPPAASAVAPGRPVTATGKVRSLRVSPLTWPAEFDPQHSIMPPLATAQVCEPPAEIARALAFGGTPPGAEAAPAPAQAKSAVAPITQSSPRVRPTTARRPFGVRSP